MRYNKTSRPLLIVPNSCPNCAGVGWVESEVWSLMKLTKITALKVRCQQCNGLGIIDINGPQLAQ